MEGLTWDVCYWLNGLYWLLVAGCALPRFQRDSLLNPQKYFFVSRRARRGHRDLGFFLSADPAFSGTGSRKEKINQPWGQVLTVNILPGIAVFIYRS